MAYPLSFQEYVEKQDLLTEAGLLKRLNSFATEKKTDLATAHAKRHADQLGATAGFGGVAGNVANAAANIATGNWIGAGKSIWDAISGAVKGSKGLYKTGKAMMYIKEIMKHRAALHEHFIKNEGLGEQESKEIVDAIFEVDGELFDEMSEKYWAEGTKRFAEGLTTGYHDISKKIFAAVMAKLISEWAAKMVGHAEELDTVIQRIMGERKEKLEILRDPEVQEAIADFDPPELDDEAKEEGVFSKGQAPRTVEEFDRMRAPRQSDLKAGQVIYLKWGKEIEPAVVITPTGQSGELYVLAANAKWVRTENPESVRTIGEKIEDKKDTPLWKNLMRVIEKDPNQLGHWAKENGIEADQKITKQELERTIVKRLNWPRMIQNGDPAIVNFRGEESGTIELRSDPLEIDLAQKYGIEDFIAHWFKVRGYVNTGQTNRYGEPFKISFGYDAEYKDLPKWDAKRRAWIVYPDEP